MMAAAERRLWGAAAAVSIALHIALAFGLLVIPAPQSATTASTNIVLLSSQVQTAPAVAAGSVGQAQAAPVASQTVEARVDRTAVAMAGNEPVTAFRTAPDSVGSTRRDAAVAARARSEHRPVDPASRFEVAAVRREDTSIAPVSSSRSPGPRPPSESARPSPAAKQVIARASGAQPAEGGETVAPTSPFLTARPTASPGDVITPAVTPARPPATPAAVTAAASGGETDALPAAAGAARPSLPLQAIPPSQFGAADRQSSAVQIPATSAESVQTEQRTAAIVRPVEPATARSREDIENAYLDLLSMLRGRRGESCLLALVELVGRSARVDGFAAAAADASELDHRLQRDAVLPVDHRRYTVTDAQCAALDFAASLASYPESDLAIELESAEIVSGAALSGRVTNLQRSWVYLLVVDDEGYVHELRDLAFDGEALSFRVPLTLTEGPVATVQLLLALSSDALLTNIRRNDGQEAGAYFEVLRDDIAHSGGGVDFGMVPFLVR